MSSLAKTDLNHSMNIISDYLFIICALVRVLSLFSFFLNFEYHFIKRLQI